MNKKDPKDRAEPFTESEIVNAIQYSGFPLEIRLLEAFHHAGFDPTIGMRFVPGKKGTQSAEIDLMARCGAILADSKGLIYLTALIEAKQLSQRVNFVGFKWKQPDAHELRSMRIRFSGLPTCQVLPKGPNGGDLVQLMLGGSDPIAKALDPLNEPTVCPHWAYVRDAKDHIEVRKEADQRESFAKLVRTTTWLEQVNAKFLVNHPVNPEQPPQLLMQILSPTIVLATPHLYLYDPLAKTLDRTQSLVIQEMHEFRGAVHARYIDVITEDALPVFLERYRRVVKGLQSACDKNIHRLVELAKEQQANPNPYATLLRTMTKSRH